MMMARGLLQAGARSTSARASRAGEAAAEELSKYGTVLSVGRTCPGEECLRLAAEVGRSEEGIQSWSINAGTNWGARWRSSPRTAGTGRRPNLKTPF